MVFIEVTKMLVFWDVDTQKDFMNKDGALYVPNAEKIIPNLKKLTDHAIYKGITILGSVDRHFEDDDELKTFPPHCMNKTEGQRKIPETHRNSIDFIESKVSPFGNYMEYQNNEIILYKVASKHMIFEKQHTDVFTNRSVIRFLNKLRISKAIVYGVATEYCVKDVVLGLLKLGIEVYIVEDAIQHINYDEMIKATDEMIEQGVGFIKTYEILESDILK